MSGSLTQHATRRPRRVLEVIGKIIKKALDSMWVFQATQLPKLGPSKAHLVVVHGLAAVYLTRADFPQSAAEERNQSGRLLRAPAMNDNLLTPVLRGADKQQAANRREY
jgi:hypothetical protein